MVEATVGELLPRPSATGGVGKRAQKRSQLKARGNSACACATVRTTTTTYKYCACWPWLHAAHVLALAADGRRCPQSTARCRSAWPMAARVAPAHDGIQPPAPRRLAAVAGHLGPRAAAEAAAAPFVPAPLLPGGQVLTLFAPGSPLLNAERVHEPESYNHRGDPIDLAATAAGKTRTAVNVHNPSIEAHILPPGPQNTGSAIIVIPGGGHQILMIGPEGGDCVPFFTNYGISTIILRERLRIDGCANHTRMIGVTFPELLTRVNGRV